MKKYIYLFILFMCFLGCSAQKKYKTIDENNYRLVTTFSIKDKNNTQFLKNEAELKGFYQNLEREFKKSTPRIVVNFNEKQIALIHKKHIDSYNIDSISGNDKIFQINLSLLKNVNVSNDSSNFLMIVIPKTIKKITLKENN